MSILSVEDQFTAAMQADATVASYFGTATNWRLYDTQLPQNALTPGAGPAGIYHRISTVPLYTHGAPDNSDVYRGLNGNSGMVRFQITVWADTSSVRPPNQARQIAEAIKNALKSFSAWDGSNRGPNRIVNQRGGVEPQTQPPIPFQSFDVIIPYADNT